ncbi:hypothetical protein KKB99_08285, partial [bacterium]|nr:hypothetical protein [bacterium]MBU1025989.1 hypothetical protein [bacterium]
MMRVPQTLFTILIMLSLITGCSNGKSPVTGDMSQEPPSSLDSIPIIATGDDTAISLFGAFTLAISADRTKVELTPMRTPSGDVGDSYIVSGKSFFDMLPCTDCLKLAGMD